MTPRTTFLMLALAAPLLAADCDGLVGAFRNAEAAGCFEAALGADPGDFDLRCKLTRALVDAGEDQDGDGAEAWFRRAVEQSRVLVRERPERAEGHYYLAVSLGRLAQFLGGKEKVALAAEIRRSVDRALAIDPRHAEALLTRGIYFYELATLNSALRLFAKMLYGGLPEGSLEDAESDLRASLALMPENSNTIYHLALVAYENEDWSSCLDHCRRVAALPPSDNMDGRNKALAKDLAGKAEKKLDRSRRGR